MQKALALCMTALLLLAGCLGTEDVDDAEDIVEDVLEIEGCGDETSLTYVANVTNSSDDLCVYEDTLETTIADFISLIENGPDMETLDSTIGYSMELSEVYVDMDDCYEWEYYNPDLVDENQPYNGCPDVVEENIHYLETIVISPTGYKATMEHSIDGETEFSEVILSGNEVQFHLMNSTEDYTVRMKHAGTFESAMELMMPDDEDDDMGSDENEMVCYDMDTHMILYEYDDQMDCEAEGYMWVPADSGPSDGGDDLEMEDDSEPQASDYTQYFNPLTATITSYAIDETGYTFSGMLNINDAPYSYLEIHTDSTFTVLGFTMEDTEEEDNWVEFMMISSGDTSTDETIALSALPYILFDMSDMSGDDDDDDDDEDYTFYCSNDGEDYAEAMGGILCPEGPGVTPDCPNGEPCICIDVDGSCDDGDDDWGYSEDNDNGDEEEFHYYDNYADEGDHYECWMDEWDYDNDGDYEESHGYDYADCSQESNSSWMCFAGYEDDHDEEVEYYYYDNCNLDNETDLYECVTPEGADVWENCELESNGTWRCWHDYDFEFEDLYYCIPFVAQNSAGFSIFNNTSLDESMCGMEVIEDTHEFDNSTFTMPIHLTYEDCWMEDNESVCETGDVYYDVNTTMLWETAHENNYMDCEGDYDNNTSMCTELLGNITQADGSAFLLVNEHHESLMMYQYDEPTQSGLLIMVMTDGDDDDDMDLNATFAYLDADHDGEIAISEWTDMINQSDGEMSEEEFNGFAMTFDMYDEDNSSGLNFDEFVDMMEAINNGDGEMNPELMFNMFDANGDGQVTASEWFDWSNTTEEEPMPEEDFDMFAGMMDNYDDDDSGGLDFDEFMTFMEELEGMEDGGSDDIKMFMVIGVLPYGADVDDYTVDLAMCNGESLEDLQCDDPKYSRALAEIMVSSEEEAMVVLMGQSIVFVDADGNGTLTSGDYIMINNATLDVDQEWNFARLYSSEAGAYSDENPMMSMLPGFTGLIATIGLLGAALIRRE